MYYTFKVCFHAKIIVVTVTNISRVAFIGCLGLIGANSAAGMLDPYGKAAGIASSVMGAGRFLVSAQPADAIMPPSSTRVCPTTQAAAREER